jgi:hypothetical protein
MIHNPHVYSYATYTNHFWHSCTYSIYIICTGFFSFNYASRRSQDEMKKIAVDYYRYWLHSTATKVTLVTKVVLFYPIKKNLELSRRFCNPHKYKISWKSVQRTHMMKLTVAFRNSANVPKNDADACNDCGFQVERRDCASICMMCTYRRKLRTGHKDPEAE